MGAAASLASHQACGNTTGTQQQQQPLPPPRKQRQQQQQDWSSILGLVLDQLPEAADDTDVTQDDAGRALHRVSKQLRAAACTTVRHFSLQQYQDGRRSAKEAWRNTQTFHTALAAAAAAPPIPWALLAAMPSLTSLHLVGSQAHRLTRADGTAGTPEAQVLAATLARLQCLEADRLESEPHLRHTGWLLGRCTQLTKLVLNGGTMLPCSILCEGLEAGAAAAAAAAAAAGAPVAAGGRQTSSHLPALQHLQLTDDCTGLASALLSLPGVARQVTALRLDSDSYYLPAFRALEGPVLASCSRLQELLVGCSRSDPEEVPEELGQLTALTKLVLRKAPFVEVPAVVCSLTGLRHLDLVKCRNLRVTPSSMSQLQQLEHLDLTRTKVQQLPEELGTWLPKLEVLEVNNTAVRALPPGLSRLTRLGAKHSYIQVPALQNLVTLKELDVRYCLRPPFQALSRLSALEGLRIDWEDSAGFCLQGPLPNLRSLRLRAYSGIPAGVLQVLEGAQQLTHLKLALGTPNQLAALWQVGVLPQLQSLVITCRDKGDHSVLQPPAAIPWLQQQPRLTSLRIHCCMLEAAQLEQLPSQLEALNLCRCTLTDNEPGVLTQLTRLHTLWLPPVRRVPPWLPRLTRLELVDFPDMYFEEELEHGWELLAQLPLLRQVGIMDEALPHGPHLCWSRPHWLESEKDAVADE